MIKFFWTWILLDHEFFLGQNSFKQNFYHVTIFFSTDMFWTSFLSPQFSLDKNFVLDQQLYFYQKQRSKKMYGPKKLCQKQCCKRGNMNPRISASSKEKAIFSVANVIWVYIAQRRMKSNINTRLTAAGALVHHLQHRMAWNTSTPA